MIKVLVIDDEQIIWFGVKQTLEPEGMTVDHAENGIIGLEKIKQHQYDLVLIDIKMPKISGMEVLESIQQYNSNIVSIITTGYATIEMAENAIQKGAFDYLPKPFTPNELRDVVRRGLAYREKLVKNNSI